MRYDPERHHRRSIRLKDCDYTRMGAYFVTLCTQGRVCLFGEIVAGEMRLNEYGEIVQKEWFRSAEIRREIVLFSDEFVVMPNHIHGIVRIVESPNAHVGATGPTAGATDAHGRGDRRHGRGDRPVAPTRPRQTFIGIVRCRVQIGRHQTHQRSPWHGRRHHLATQLLRTHHPPRGIPQPHPRLHPGQPPSMASGPRTRAGNRRSPVGGRMSGVAWRTGRTWYGLSVPRK
jgi:hypothetical protein